MSNNSVLERYAFAYIKKSGSDSNVQEFLRSHGMRSITNWSGMDFENAYHEFRRYNLSNEHNVGNERDRSQPTDHQPQVTHIYVRNNRGLDFWDYLLLCNLFGGNTGHTTVINNPGSINGSQQSREDKKKGAEDSTKLLALGIVVAVVAFHVGMCFGYSSSRKAARKSEKIDYLDNQLKRFRNIEFTVSAISLVTLVCCAVNLVLPVWGLVILGINSLVCFTGGLAFHMKHEKELEDIEKAKEVVSSYLGHGDFGDSSHRGAPPSYFSHDFNSDVPSAPPQSTFSNSYSEQYVGGYEQQTTYSKV